MFVPSTQTWSPLLYGLNLLFPWFLMAIIFCARPISANGNHWCQLFWSSQKHRRYCSSHWFVRSDCPSVLGWYAVEMFWRILSAWHNPLVSILNVLRVALKILFFDSPIRR